MTPKIYCLPSFSYDGGHCDPLNKKFRKSPGHPITTLQHFQEENFWKHCGKNKKILVTSIFFFSHTIFYLLKDIPVMLSIWARLKFCHPIKVICRVALKLLPCSTKLLPKFSGGKSHFSLNIWASLIPEVCKQFSKTRGPRWPWIAYLNFRGYPSHFFFFFFVCSFLFVAFREEFTRISFSVVQCKWPPPLIPCLLTDQNFAYKFWKGSLKEHFYEIISKSDQ